MKYTIKDLAEGRCSLKNDDTIENLQLVLDKAFPKDKAKVSDWVGRVGQNKVLQFQRAFSKHSEWVQVYENDPKTWTATPMQSCSVFLEEINYGDRGITITREEDKVSSEPKQMREFSTGATRNLADGKLDFEGFLSPLALEEFAKYMHKNRMQADGKLRDSDNWQRGIEINSYMSSMWRHFFDTWKNHRGLDTHEDQISNLCGLMFNVQGMLHELLKQK